MKSLFASKTFWFNILTVAAVALSAVAGHPLVEATPAAASVILVATSVVNLGLRLFTVTGVKL
jgi:hypothetical protein